jgi:hypothetical protein
VRSASAAAVAAAAVANVRSVNGAAAAAAAANTTATTTASTTTTAAAAVQIVCMSATLPNLDEIRRGVGGVGAAAYETQWRPYVVQQRHFVLFVLILSLC